MDTYELYKKDEKKPRKTNDFFLGFLFYNAINGLIQDWMGLDGYLSHVKNHWINTHWFMWLIISIFTLYLYFKKNSYETNRRTEIKNSSDIN